MCCSRLRLLTALVLATWLQSCTCQSSFDSLPAGADELLRDPLNTEFSCEGRDYNYYADVKNNCQLFHICLPVMDDAGRTISTTMFTMLCSNGTVFDQQTLTCNFEADSFPCSESESLYNSVKFGVETEQASLGDETLRLKRKARRLRKVRKIAAKDLVVPKDSAVLVGHDLGEVVGARFRERAPVQN